MKHLSKNQNSKAPSDSKQKDNSLTVTTISSKFVYKNFVEGDWERMNFEFTQLKKIVNLEKFKFSELQKSQPDQIVPNFARSGKGEISTLTSRTIATNFFLSITCHLID